MPSTAEAEKDKDKSKKVRKRCGKCEACKREDCGTCAECLRKKKFGGVGGGSKQACAKRRCRYLEDLKKERKRNRMGVDDDEAERSGKRRRTNSASKSTRGGAGSNEDSNNEHMGKDPIVELLEEAYPDPVSSMLADAQVKKAIQEEQRKPPPTTTCNLRNYQYGHAVPEPVTNICAGCKSSHAPVYEDDPEREVVILLCDGPDCNNEYHLECCIPHISDIPEGAYYCVDCDPSGSAKVLNKYLDKHDDRRHKEQLATAGNSNNNPFQFLFALWKEDLEENQENWRDEKQNGDGTTANNYQRVPQSELSRLLEVQHHLRGSSWPAGKAYSLDELGTLLVGKPVRLYNPLDDNYHSGRIVDYRPIPPNLHQMPKKGSKNTATINTSAKNCHPNDDFFANKIEFLVRFLPGTNEYRKTLVTRWIRLEEHSLAVGTHLVWGKFQPPAPPDNKKGGGPVVVHHGSPTPAWTPSLLFLRTSRELMPVLHLLQESEGEISYHPDNLFPKNRSKPAHNPCAAPLAKMDPKHVWALAKRIGASNHPVAEPGAVQEAYKLLRVTEETKDISARQPSASSRVDRLMYSLAQAEEREQAACLRWRNLKLTNKFHPKGLQARDEYGLGPVAFQNELPRTKEEGELCPLIRAPGLDRGHLMERLVKRGTVEEATKETAAGLECWLIP